MVDDLTEIPSPQAFFQETDITPIAQIHDLGGDLKGALHGLSERFPPDLALSQGGKISRLFPSLEVLRWQYGLHC